MIKIWDLIDWEIKFRRLFLNDKFLPHSTMIGKYGAGKVIRTERGQESLRDDDR